MAKDTFEAKWEEWKQLKREVQNEIDHVQRELRKINLFLENMERFIKGRENH